MEQILLFLFLAIVYFIPSFFAMDKKNSTGIFALNLFLGWTFIGWVGALIWALCAKDNVKPRKPALKVSLCPYCLVETRTTTENRCVECHGIKN